MDGKVKEISHFIPPARCKVKWLHRHNVEACGARLDWLHSFAFRFGAQGLNSSAMALMPYLAWAGLLIFAGMSFFFALAESALFSLGKWQVRQLSERVPVSGVLVERLLTEPEHLLATIVLGNTVANASIVAISLWSAWDHWMLIFMVPSLFVLLLVGCEVVPKTLAVRAPESWAVRVAGPMYFLQSFTGPLHRLARQIDAFILNVLVPKSVKPLAAI